MHRIGQAAGMAALLAACTPQGPHVEPPVTLPVFDAQVLTKPPAPGMGGCWHESLRPALFETVTEQVQTAPERRDAAGRLLAPATFRSEVHQSQLRPRQSIWFRTLCPQDGLQDPIFLASLQRALKARGLYAGQIDGQMTAQTGAAVQAYQSHSGLQSPVLSIAAARALGLIVIDG